MLGFGLNLGLKQTVSGEFSLENYSGLQYWYKNKTGVSGTADGETLIWADQSGNNNNAVQATHSEKPTYSASDGSFDFVGSTNLTPIYFDLTSSLSLGAFTAFFVLDMIIEGVNEFYGLLQNSSYSDYIQIFGNETQLFYYVDNGVADIGAEAGVSNAPTNGTKFVFSVRKSSVSNSTIEFRNNDNLIVSTTDLTDGNTVDLETIGYSGSGGRSHDGKFYELAMYNTSLTDSQVTKVVNDLKSRNGIS